MREYSFGSDGDFTREGFIHRINSDLANDLGNLLNRTLAMVKQNFGEIVPSPTPIENELDTELINMATETFPKIKPLMDNLSFNTALETIWELVRRANKYLDETAPWRLAKDPSNRERLATVLYNCIETLRFLSILISPFMPNSSIKIREQIGISESQTFADLEWGKAPHGIRLGKVEPIFPRIEVKTKVEDKPIESKTTESEITIDDFRALDLRVVQVLSAEPVEGTDKLLLLK